MKSASDYDSRKHTTHTYALRKTLARMHIHTHHINEHVLPERIQERDYFQNRQIHSVKIWDFLHSLQIVLETLLQQTDESCIRLLV